MSHLKGAFVLTLLCAKEENISSNSGIRKRLDKTHYEDCEEQDYEEEKRVGERLIHHAEDVSRNVFVNTAVAPPT